MIITKKPRTVVAVLAAIPLTIALLTACSAGGTAEKPGSNTGNAAQHSTLSYEDWQLAFAKCMRGEGIDYPDPGKGGLTVIQGAADSPEAAKASDKCITKLGISPAAPGAGQGTDEQQLEAGLKRAKCFRDNGVNVADPKKGDAAPMPEDAPPAVIAKCAPDAGSGDQGGVRPNG